MVLSSRVRLARNAAGEPFPDRLSDAERAALRERIFAAAEAAFFGEFFFEMERLAPVARKALLERHLASKELLAGGGRGVLCDAEERLALLVNEEDHLRFSAFRRGLDLADAYAVLVGFVRAVEERLPFAFDDDLGYLTACPTNLGTALRASALLHLPALVRMNRMRTVAESASGLGMLLRGAYGEGSESQGHVFQLSNRITLGFSEIAILERTEGWIRGIAEREREGRDELFTRNRHECEDRVHRALAVARSARLLSAKETADLLSWILLGADRGILDVDPERVLACFVLTGEAHVRLRAAQEGADHLNPLEVRAARADFLRAWL